MVVLLNDGNLLKYVLGLEIEHIDLLEIKEMMARHKQELTEKDATIASVSKVLGSFLAVIKLL